MRSRRAWSPQLSALSALRALSALSALRTLRTLRALTAPSAPSAPSQSPQSPQRLQRPQRSPRPQRPPRHHTARSTPCARNMCSNFGTACARPAKNFSVYLTCLSCNCLMLSQQRACQIACKCPSPPPPPQQFQTLRDPAAS